MRIFRPVSALAQFVGRHKRRSTLVLFALLAGGYLLGGFVGVPLVGRYVVLPLVAEKINGTVTVDRIACNPLRLSLTLGGVEVLDQQGVRTLGLEEFRANLSSSSAWRWAVVLDEIIVAKPFASAVLEEDGSINLIKLIKLEPSTEPSKPFESPRLIVKKLDINGVELRFEDRSLDHPFTYAVTDLGLTLNHFDTKPQHANLPRFEATLGETSRVAWEGEFFLDPISSTGRLTVEGFELTQFLPYAQALAEIDGQGGVVSFVLDYELAPVRDTPVMKAKLENFKVEGLELFALDPIASAASSTNAASTQPTVPPGPYLGVQGVKLDRMEVDAIAHVLSLGTLTVQGVQLQAERRADGQLDWLALVDPALLESSPGSENTTEAKAPQQQIAELKDSSLTDYERFENPNTIEAQIALLASHLVDIAYNLVDATMQGSWDIELESLRLADIAVHANDEAAGDRPAELKIDDFELNLGPIASSARYAFPLEGGGNILGGSLTFHGQVEPMDLVAELKAQVDGIPLAPVGVYGETLAQTITGETLQINDGAVRADLHATVDLSKAGGPFNLPTATLTGTAGLNQLLIERPDHEQAAVRVTDADVAGIDIATVPLRARVDRVHVQQPEAFGDVAWFLAAPKEDSPHSESNSAEPAESEGSPLETKHPLGLPDWLIEADLMLGELVVEQAKLGAEDTRVDPPRQIDLGPADVKLTGHGTGPDATGLIDVRANVMGTGHVGIQGHARLLTVDPDVKLTVTTRTLPILPGSPFLAPILGYEIDSGAATVALLAEVQGTKLKLEQQGDDLLLDNFRLGEPVESSMAIKAPVKLALDLLRDPSGNIQLGLPTVNGDLADASFALAPLIAQGMTSVIKNIAARPFQIIGALLPERESQDPDGLQRIAFNPGSSQISADSLETLEALAKALSQRPGLTLTLRGSVDPESDALALRRQALRQTVLASPEALARTEGQAVEPGSIIETQIYRAVVVAKVHAAEAQAETEQAEASEPEEGGLAGTLRNFFKASDESSDIYGDEQGLLEQSSNPEVQALFEGAEQQLLANVPVQPKALEKLVDARALAVQAKLIELGLTNDRLTIPSQSIPTEEVQDDNDAPEDKSQEPAGAAVIFELGV